MTLDDMMGNNMIDATAGKVNPVEHVVQTNGSTDPQFASNERIRGVPEGMETTSRTPVYDNIANVPTAQPAKEIKVIQSAPVDLSEGKKFDISSLPSKPAEPNQLEENLMDDLSRAVERECDSITERMNGVLEMQRQEMIQELQAKEVSNNNSIPVDMGVYDEGVEVETEVIYDSAPTAEDNTETVIQEPIYTPSVTTQRYPANAPVEEEISVSINVEDTYTPSDDAIFNVSNDIEVTEDKVEAALDVPEEETANEDDFSVELDLLQTFSNADMIPNDNETLAPAAPNDEEIIEQLKSEVSRVISPIKEKVDFSKFSIAKAPMAASKIINFSVKDVNRADWILPNAKTAVSVTGLSGPELIMMDPTNTTRNKVNTQKDIYSVIYRHIDNPNKGSFEFWLKTTRFSDIQHVYFALYMATFKGSNFIHYECPKCGNIFIHDMDFEDIVKYKDEETKKKVNDIINGHLYNQKAYPVTRYQMSDDYVVDIKEPSMWNTVIEASSLSSAFTEKYADVVNLIASINAIYYIDRNAMQLVPIETDPVKGDVARTTANKYSIYGDVLRKLPSDDFFALRSKVISVVGEEEDMFTYRTPACKCPKCNADIPETPREGAEMLFTRHQLGALGVI